MHQDNALELTGLSVWVSKAVSKATLATNNSTLALLTLVKGPYTLDGIRGGVQGSS